jgi:membrane associated rhomboid family serine protease
VLVESNGHTGALSGLRLGAMKNFRKMAKLFLEVTFPRRYRPLMRMITDKFRPIIVLVALVWAVEAVNIFLGHGLASWGILPRSLGGLVGIPLAPLLHGGFWHTVSNTLPLLFLGGLVLAGGRRMFWETTVSITLLSGLLVWLFARDAYHVGASGLVFGYFGAILARAVIQRSLASMAIGIITVMAYGGLIWGILPLRSYVSFESHLFGLIAGIFVVWLEVKLGRSKPTG